MAKKPQAVNWRVKSMIIILLNLITMTPITAKKLTETWQITDGKSKVNITVHTDYSFEVLRLRVEDESFIPEAIKTLTNHITI